MFDIRDAAGALLFALGIIAFMGIITAEALYPGYSTSKNAISDLGGSPPPEAVVKQPSSTIFNAAMLASGALAIASAYFIHRTFRERIFTGLFASFSSGLFGIGVFPGNTGLPHIVLAQMMFISGGLAPIAYFRIERSRFRYISLLVGIVVLSAYVLYALVETVLDAGAIGTGGVERWVMYPILFWCIGLGARIMGGKGEPSTER